MSCGAGARAVRALTTIRTSGRQSSCEGVKDFNVETMQMWHQLQPEGHLVSAVVVPDTRLQADMQVLLVFGAELGPDDFFKTVGLGVNECSVLRNW